jgi:hypothetical protein
MLKKILIPTSLKRLYKRKNSVVWLQVPTNYSSQAERDQVMEATMDLLEQIIYKNK